VNKISTGIAFCLFSIWGINLSAQVADTLKAPKEKSIARTPTVLSACLPGTGQIYNKKYWKAPIIYAGFGGLIYLYNENRKEYTAYKEAFKYAYGDTTVQLSSRAASLLNRYNIQSLETNKYFYRRNMDLTLLGMGVLYFLNIIDANVDAHLKDFEINEDLTLKMNPSLTSLGVSLTLSIK